MKPLKLNLKSFGPYIDETINFNELKNSELFLITGETGSGKTTIFDGISVALYGESSGKERSSESFKSDFTEDVMVVEFTFSIKDKIYRVKRIPKQMRKSKRGHGLVEEKGSAELFYLEDNEEILMESRMATVTEKITEILGIDAKQFRQIVMIPQGQFRKLLTDKSGDRENILRSIFDVSKYDVFAKKMKDRNKKIYSDIKNEELKLNMEIDYLKYDESNESLNKLMKCEKKDPKLIIDAINLEMEIYEDRKATLQEEQVKLKNKIEELDKKIIKSKENNKKHILLKELKAEIEIIKNGEEKYKEKTVVIEKSQSARRILPIEKIYRDVNEEIDVISTEIRKYENEDKLLLEDRSEIFEEYRILKEGSNREEVLNDGEKIGLLIEIYEKISRQVQLASDVKDYKNTIKMAEAKLEKCVEVMKSLDGKLLELEEKLLEFEDSDLIAEKIKNENLLIDSDTMSLKRITENTAHRLNTIKNIEKYRENMLLREKSLNTEKEKLKIGEKDWKHGQAYYLATQIKEGENCPVCGSKEHINLAVEPSTFISDDHIKNLRKAVDLRQKEKHDIEMIISKALIEEENYFNKIKDDYKKIWDGELRKIDRAFEEKISDEIKKKLELHETNKKRIGKLELEGREKLKLKLEVSNIKERIEKGRMVTLESENTLLSLKNKLMDESEKIIGELLRKMDIEKEKYRNKLLNLENLRSKSDQYKKQFMESLKLEKFLEEDEYIQYKKYIDQIEKLKMEVDAYRENKLKKENSYEILSKEICDTKVEDVSLLEKNKFEHGSNMEIISKKIIDIDNIVSSNKKQVESIAITYKNIASKIAYRDIINDISKVANGEGEKKISFESYVLAFYLEEVIQSANVTLYKMSGGRYELRLKKTVSDKRSKMGLDFEIFDYYTGKVRDITTLSGGEGFKASLALSLGMADVAQGYAGGISIETMFIDEGFGSLSLESLDTAIDCLLELRQMGRIIGIISHVSELKERIDTKLVIEKTKIGSKTEFVIGV